MERLSTQVAKAEPVRIEKLPELMMVGFPVVVSFKHGDFSKIGKTKALFDARKEEIQHAVDSGDVLGALVQL